MKRSWPAIGAAFLLLAALQAPQVGAQLRPLDPADWRIFDRDTELVVGAGGGVLWDQPLSLAGSRGTLLELGNYRILWRSGRIGLDLSGTAVWRLREDTITGTPAPGVEPADHDIRSDAGPVLAATIVRLTPERWSTDVMVRFGARIPTTSDESGLERDRTDWFALAGVRWKAGGWSLAGETGLGINGALPADYPQSDALLYSASVLHERGPVAAFGAVTGQFDGLSGSVLGNEDKGELRAGVRFGRRYWLQTTWVRGLSRTSPENGLLLLAGFAAGCRTDCLPFN
jgi:hypothetical protein